MKLTYSLLSLKPYLRRHLFLIIASCILAIPLAAIRLGPAPIVRYMLDDLLIRKNTSKLLWFPLALLLLYFFNFFVRFTHYYLLRIVIIRVNQEIKNKIFHHLLGLSADYFTAQSTGTLISRTAMDPQYIDAGLSCINVLVREPITLIFLLGYAFKLNWKLTFITIFIIPVLAWVFSTTGKHLKRYISKISEINAHVFSLLQESYSGIRIIKTFCLENHLYKKFLEKNNYYATFLLKASLLEEVSHPLVELLTAFILAPLLYFGGLQVIQEKMTPGDLFAFFTTFALMMNPIRMLNDLNLKLHQASAALERINEVFNWKPTLQEIPEPKRIKTFHHNIEFKEVSFAYPDNPSQLILKKVNFSVLKGQVIGLVGASGSGKSSLFNLLPRIFDTTHGSITIDGLDIRTLCLSDLRKMIAVVSQDVFLFNDTLKENIRCGNLCASDLEIKKAAKQAHVLEFIEKLPLGFKTIIGERGQKLSGGEKQRISIARAFLREAPILILDEATSSLDSTSERAVQSALQELMLNRTTLMIAHRLSTIQHADLILVLKDGRIIESGQHKDLLAQNGAYTQFYGLVSA